MTLGTINVNSVCAHYNYESYINGRLNTIDISAIYELGDEGIPYIIKLTEHEDIAVSCKAMEYLTEAYLYDYFSDLDTVQDITIDTLSKNQNNKGFKYFSIPKKKAYDELYKFFENNPDFIKYRL
jgi:hypothetical protein